jgi:hypothetical protein
MTMKRTTSLKIVGVAVLILLGAISATAQDIKYNFMPGTDFTKYKTYRWARVPNAQYPDQIIDTQITGAIDSQLALKGLSKSNDETADLVVTYQIAVSSEKQWNSFSSGGGGWGYGRWGGWGGYGGGMSTTTTTSETIHVGTLDVDIYDAAAKNQVWKGQASKTLGNGKDPAKVNKNINKAMEKLFKKYPPPVKK